MTALPAKTALDAYFLEARCKLLDLAGILDRIGRGDDAGPVAADPRMARIRTALMALLDSPDGRAELVQNIFSLAYDPSWPVPAPK
jgi:hypothetical protein